MLLYVPCLHQEADQYPCVRRAGRNFYLNILVFLHSRMVGIEYVYGLGVPMWRIGPKGLEPHPRVAIPPMT